MKCNLKNYFVSLAVLMVISGCPGPSGNIQDLNGYWLVNMTSDYWDEETIEWMVWNMRVDEEIFGLGIDGPCQFSSSGGSFTIAYDIEPVEISTNCVMTEYRYLFKGKVSGDSLSARFGTSAYMEGDGCPALGYSIGYQERFGVDIEGEKMHPDPDNFVTLSGYYNGTYFGIDTTEAVCARIVTRDRPEFHILGKHEGEYFDLVIVVHNDMCELDLSVGENEEINFYRDAGITIVESGEDVQMTIDLSYEGLDVEHGIEGSISVECPTVIGNP